MQLTHLALVLGVGLGSGLGLWLRVCVQLTHPRGVALSGEGQQQPAPLLRELVRRAWLGLGLGLGFG